MIRAGCLILILLTTISGCGNDTPPAQQAVSAAPVAAPAATPVPDTPPVAAPAPVADTPQTFLARVLVVDLNGTPLANMLPIVTRQPNAFDPPLATGTPTDAGGRGSVTFDVTDKVCIRAWDPVLEYFPNNFYEVLPGVAGLENELQIVMVTGSIITAQLFGIEGSAVADRAVKLMLSHPTRGPWWPAEARTGPDGMVRFGPVPAGEFVLQFQTETGLALEHPPVPLPPAQTTDLGVLTLH